MTATSKLVGSLMGAVVCLSTIACGGIADEKRMGAARASATFDHGDAVQAAPASEASSGTQPNEHCLPEIGTTGTWLAADGGRTIPLSNGTSIHLFGDTMLDASTPDDPTAFEFVGNSIGLVHCAGGQYSVEYIWAVRDGEREAFFDIGVPGVRLWPVDGFEREGRLHVLLTKIIATDDGFGFDCIGTEWATIDNPFDAPRDWRISYQDFTAAGTYLPDKGITVENGYAYLFSSLLVGDYPQPAILLRLPLSSLDAPGEHLEYLAVGGDWRSTTRFAGDARIVVQEASPNMYVHYHSGLGRYVTVHADPVFGSPEMVVQTAESLEGPWSEGVPVFEFPEMLAPRADGADVICYAVTEHPELRMNGDNTLVVTYSCNTPGAPVPARKDLGVYYPKTVTIDVGRIKDSLGVAGS